MGEQVSMLQDEASFGFMPECGRTESCGRSISIVLRNCHTDTIVALQVCTPPAVDESSPYTHSC